MNARNQAVQAAGNFALFDAQIENVKRQLEAYEDNLSTGVIGGGSGLALGLAFIASARRRREG
jgi:hypothetical protein